MSQRLRGWAASLVACGVLMAPMVFARAEAPGKQPVKAPATQPSTLPAEALQKLWTAATRPSTQPDARPTAPPVEPPRTVAELRELEKKVQGVVRRGLAATVGLRTRGGQGSGVIISKDGYILTAAHVIGEPGRTVTVILHNGREVAAKSLGVNKEIDSGMVKITEEGEDWPFMPVGESEDLRRGQWCVALGHPGGYRSDRPPVLRVGRVLSTRDEFLMTDCTLVGGDSGGPLFDLDGNVIGIHSRIGNPTSMNMHVPVDTYTETWDRLAAGESWGDLRLVKPNPNRPRLGVAGEDVRGGFRVDSVVAGSAAEKAGIQLGDVIIRLDNRPVTDFARLAEALDRRKGGDEVDVQVRRDGRVVELKARLGAPR